MDLFSQEEEKIEMMFEEAKLAARPETDVWWCLTYRNDFKHGMENLFEYPTLIFWNCIMWRPIEHILCRF